MEDECCGITFVLVKQLREPVPILTRHRIQGRGIVLTYGYVAEPISSLNVSLPDSCEKDSGHIRLMYIPTVVDRVFLAVEAWLRK